MRVLVVTTWFPSPASPESGIFIQRDVELLSQTHQVEVLHLCAPRFRNEPRTSDLAGGVKLTRLAMSPANPVSIARAAAEIRRRLPEHDLLHTMAASSLLPFALLCRSLPWVHTEHWSGLLAPETLARVPRLTLPFIFKELGRPDVVVAVGSLLAKLIQNHRSGRVRVIPNAVVSPELLTPRPKLRPTLGLVAVGGLIPRKGPEIALGAIRHLRDNGTNVELRWIGEGPLRSELERQTVELGLEDAIEWSGVVDTAAVLAALAEADAYILPTSGETFGVSIAEALASGRPVVVGASGGHTDFVHEPNGVLITERSGAAFAAGVLRVLELNRGRTAEDIAASLGEAYAPVNRIRSYEAVYAEAIAAADERRREIGRR